MSARAQQLDVAAAVGQEVEDGSCIWLGNFGTQVFAVGRALIDQRRRNLHVVIGSGGLLLDQLLAAKAVSEVTFAHCWSPVGPYPTRAFRAAWEQDVDVLFHELSLGMLSAALEAGAAGLAFAPVTGPADTDYLVWSPTSLARVDSPFGAELVVRAVAPDVAFLHAALADEWGNAALGTPVGEAPLAMAAAARTVVIAERIGTLAEVSALGIDVPGVLVDCVCETPGAAQPDGVPGLYARDIHAYEQYAQR